MNVVPTVFEEIAVIWMVAGSIGIAHLPHSISGSVEVLFGVLSGSEVTVLDYAGVLFWSTVGNVGGGGVFVALLKHSHVVRGGEEPGGITPSEKSARERRVDDRERRVDDRR